MSELLLLNDQKELGLPNYGFHIFRHTHASLMLNAGANWKKNCKNVWDTDLFPTTMDNYAELDPNRKNEAVDILIERLAQIKN